MTITIVVGMVAGGVGAHVRSLARHLQPLGFTVVVAGPVETERRFDFTAAGARFVPVAIGSAANPRADLTAIRALRRVFADTDVVHAHGFRAAALSGLALGHRRPGRVPMIATWHNAVLAQGWRRRLLGGIERLAARRADVTLGASPDLLERARELGAHRVRLAPVAAPLVGAATRDAAAIRAELNAQDRPLVVTVSRLAEQKGLDTLLAAAARLSTRQPTPLLVVAGDGPEYGRLQAAIDRDGLPVRLLGRRADIPDLLRTADLFLLTSVWEARPLVLQEAMQVGLPVVATRVGGVPTLVGSGAELVPARDDVAIAELVGQLLDDPQRRADLAARGREHAARWPTEADNAQLIADLCAQLVG